MRNVGLSLQEPSGCANQRKRCSYSLETQDSNSLLPVHFGFEPTLHPLLRCTFATNHTPTKKTPACDGSSNSSNSNDDRRGHEGDLSVRGWNEETLNDEVGGRVARGYDTAAAAAGTASSAHYRNGDEQVLSMMISSCCSHSFALGILLSNIILSTYEFGDPYLAEHPSTNVVRGGLLDVTFKLHVHIFRRLLRRIPGLSSSQTLV